MSDTLFWSWQDDLPSKTNRSFIRDCLVAAVDRVSNALDVDEMERVDLDHDTKGTPGMADISQTILEKITGYAVMVADVTPIVRTEAGKALPNPNVMVELGFAMNAIRFDRIIAVLNTANGDRVETLPFDIRHRRILTYALAEDATKADRRAQRDALTSKLADAIAVNISQVRDERSASDEIVGAASDPGSDGLWNADWPIQHVGPFGATQKVSPISVSRAWLRVIPAGFRDGVPPISAVEQLSENARLWAPRGAGNGGDSGSSGFGFVSYWISGEEDDGTRQAHNLASFLEDTGEVWMSDGVAFEHRKDRNWISYAHLLTNWARGLENAMACLDALGASSRRRVIVGVEGLEGAFWPAQDGYIPAQSRKPDLLYDRTKRTWPAEVQTEFLRTAWNGLRNAFSLEPMTEEDFARYYEVRKRS